MSLQKSLVLVTVDCLRADHVGFMGYKRPTTPFLDSLSSQSFVFQAAITGGAPTYYSFPTILASRYPLALGRDQIGLAPGEASLATILKEAGYATAAFCAGNPYLSARFGYEQGFDIFEDFLAPGAGIAPESSPILTSNGSWITSLNRKLEASSHRLGPIGALYDELYFQYCQRWGSVPAKSLEDLRRFPAADVLISKSLDWVDSLGDRPFFLWLHFMDPHSPYYPKQTALEAMGERNLTPTRARYLNSYWNRSDLGPARLSRHRDEVIRLYDAGIRWVDTQLARLVGHLQKLNLWDKCVFAFTADHGEEFIDHGGRYHPPNRLTEELIRVPLMIRVPEVRPKQPPDAPFSHLHLAPTLLEAAGVQPSSAFQGQSLWLQVQAGSPWQLPVIAESVHGCTNPFLPENRLGPRVLALREAQYKLIVYFDTHSDVLFDLKTDPQELSPMPQEEARAVRRHLLDIARAHLSRARSETRLQDRLRLQLRDLQLKWSGPAKAI